MPEPLPSSSFSLRHEFTLYRLPNCMTAPIITPMGFQYANFEIINIMSAHLPSFDYLIAPAKWPCFMFYFITSGTSMERTTKWPKNPDRDINFLLYPQSLAMKYLNFLFYVWKSQEEGNFSAKVIFGIFDQAFCCPDRKLDPFVYIFLKIRLQLCMLCSELF